MKKAVVCLLLALTLSVLCQRQVIDALMTAARGVISQYMPAQEQPAPDAPTYAQQLGDSAAHDTLPATLYYRFAGTRLLGAEQILLDIRREETVARSIVDALIEGPSASHARLTGLFPQGTRVISVTGEGSTAVVTLIRGFLGRPDGAPADWEDIEYWQEEATLRRYLAMQSIVLSLTEEGRYQRVQLYVADNDDEIPERLELYWFDRTQEDLSVVLGACARDAQAMLTPERTLDMALAAWQERDWETLYLFLAAQEDEQLPSYSVFEAEMKERDISLLEYAISGGTVGMDGQSATLVLDAALRSVDGGDAQIVRESVLLTRVTDNWTISPKTLEDLMIRD